MKNFWVYLFVFSLYSCIPLRIAPEIKDEKITNAKKFKKDLPNFQGFIFEDTKNANEFYNFINIKYDLKHVNVGANIPIIINNNTFYLSYFERERETKTLNLVPMIADAKLNQNGYDTLLEDLHTSRNGVWYIIITVTDFEIKDCLNQNHPQNQDVIKYLKNLKKEYFSSNNYIQAYFKMK